MHVPKLSFAALAVLAGCASSGASHPSDPWLRQQATAACPNPGCLFAVLVDSAGAPVTNADVELAGTAIHVTSNADGRIAIENVPLGSHRVRLFENGQAIESTPVAFGYNVQTLTIQVGNGSVRIRS